MISFFMIKPVIMVSWYINQISTGVDHTDLVVIDPMHMSYQYMPIYMTNFIIPIDELIFFRG